MEATLITIGGNDITYGATLMGAVGLIVVGLIALLIVTLSGNRRRIEEAARLASDELRSNYTRQLAERDQRIERLEAGIATQQQANSDLMAKNAAMNARMIEQAQHAEETRKRLTEVREQMTAEFKALAGEVLKSHGETFSKQNREQVDMLLKPLSEKIVQFQTGLAKDRATMSEQIRALVETNQVMTTETTNLTQALKGSSQTQGAWGEMILSTILERSGLREGEQYLTQQTHQGTNGTRIRTDVEILMPRGKRLVIDSKVSLTAFESYSSAADDVERSRHLSAHINSVRTHIKTLSGKDYQRHADSDVDYVIMFMPMESALAAASGAAPDLIQFGLENGIALTTPTTLMTILRTVRSVWDIEKRNQNAEEIAARAGALYEKVTGFLASMDNVDTSLDRARKSFDTAKSQLSEGSGNVVRQIEMLQELGAKTSKSIPAGWTDRQGLPDTGQPLLTDEPAGNTAAPED